MGGPDFRGAATPTSPRKHRQLPQIPTQPPGTEMTEIAKQMKLRMKNNQYLKAASSSSNTLSPNMRRGDLASSLGDNISVKSTDSNVSSTSDISSITQASEASRLSVQSAGPATRGGPRKLSDFSAKLKSNSSPRKKNNGRATTAAASSSQPLNRSSSSNDVSKDGSMSDTAAENFKEAKKRRASLGVKMAALVGLSKKSNSTSQLNANKESKKTKFQRTEEVGVAMDMRARSSLNKQTSRDSNDGSVCSASSDSSSAIFNTAGGDWSGSGHFIPSAELNGQMKQFVEGLGKGQKVGRQIIGTTPNGFIQLQVSFVVKPRALSVEVVRARNLVGKANKGVPACYTKLVLIGDGGIKKKTKTSRNTLNPLWQEQIIFEEYDEALHHTLQATVYGDYSKLDRRSFIGVMQLRIAELDLERGKTHMGWYRLSDPSGLAPQALNFFQEHDSGSNHSGSSQSLNNRK